MKRLLLNFKHVSILAFCFSLFVVSNAYAQDPTWTGTISSDWNNPNNWSPAAVPSPGDMIEIGAGTTNAILPSGSYFTSITLNTGAQLAMSGNATVEVLQFTGNNAILNTGNYTLTLEGNITGETHESYVNGILEISRSINSVVLEKFGDIGVSFDNTTNANWGNVTVTRSTGTAINQGIKRTWNIVPTTAANAIVNLTLSWLTTEDNGSNFSTTKAQVWQNEGINGWQPVGNPSLVPASSNVRSMLVQTTSFSSWTISPENSPLPVSWLYFNGKNTEAGNKLDWATATEKNTEAFIVERSENGREFAAIGRVEAMGNSSQEVTYTFTDKTPLSAAKTYYRLKQTDLDGSSSYSSIIAIAKNNRYDKLEASVYPNPFSETINLNLTTQETIKQLSLTSIDGKEIYSKKVLSPNDLTLTNLPVLPAGIYLLKVIGEVNATTLKVVRQ